MVVLYMICFTICEMASGRRRAPWPNQLLWAVLGLYFVWRLAVLR